MANGGCIELQYGRFAITLPHQTANGQFIFHLTTQFIDYSTKIRQFTQSRFSDSRSWTFFAAVYQSMLMMYL